MRKESGPDPAWTFCLAVTLALICASTQASPAEFRVTSFRQGLVRFDAERKPHIYAEGDSFPYVPNDNCLAMVSGRMASAPCMRHGFELTFESPDADPVMDCTTEANRGRAQIAPWSVHLGGSSGSYSKSRSWSVEGTADPGVQETVVCRVKGREVLKRTFTITDRP